MAIGDMHPDEQLVRLRRFVCQVDAATAGHGDNLRRAMAKVRGLVRQAQLEHGLSECLCSQIDPSDKPCMVCTSHDSIVERAIKTREST